MAPNFALFLSPEGIALAHRQPGGHWAVLGDTALDVPDLGASLLVLRKLAEQRAGKDFETLLILPDDQVLYTSLTAPGPDEDDRLEQIRAGLDGLTPYPVDELAYDWFPLDDGRVKLAVVAQETLEEAREFATGNGFAPAGFGARPLDNRFRGVAHFDRSIDWTAEIEDIEFGHDTWHQARAASETVEDDTAPTEDTGPDAPPEQQADPVVESEPEQPVLPEPDSQPDPKANMAATPEPPADPKTAAENHHDAGEAAAPEAAAEPQLEAAKPPATEGRPAKAEAPTQADATEAARTTEPETTPDPTPEGAPDPAETAAPLQVPAGFASRRKHAKPEAAGSLVRQRKSRFGPGAATPAPRPAPAPAESPAQDPTLPRNRKPDSGDRVEPVFGRAARKDAGSDTPKVTGPATTPARPQRAGPEPQLPPLARLKSEIAARAPEDRPPPGHNPFAGPPPSLSGEKTTLKDRVAGIGRQLSESTGKARDAASGLSGRMTAGGSAIGTRLRALGRGEAETEAQTEAPTPAPQPEPKATPAPPPAGPKKRLRLGNPGKKAKPDPAAAAALSAAPAEAITPPPAAESPRRRFSPPKRGRADPKIADADAPIMGGLLARGSIATSRGPSVRTGLILTLILLAVLGLVGIWAAFYLPETALGRWMGLGEPEEVIIADTEPEVLDVPLLASPTPSGDADPTNLASLTPEGAPPAPSVMAPQAPELLPDIDAEDLDLGPAPVASPVIDPETVLPSEEENANFYAQTGVWQRPPVITLPDPEPVLEEVIFAGLDPAVVSHDAYALTEPDFLPSRDQPRPEVDPGFPDIQLALDPDNMVAPTPEGAMTPYGILIYAGPPPVPAIPRPRDAPEVLAAAIAGSADLIITENAKDFPRGILAEEAEEVAQVFIDLGMARQELVRDREWVAIRFHR